MFPSCAGHRSVTELACLHDCLCALQTVRKKKLVIGWSSFPVPCFLKFPARFHFSMTPGPCGILNLM